ncbi:MAG TPA: Rap1a/Tai family immunity protein [Thermohalobaculum sp.]|nr:Rap1a/Tai family immunity protein [Thermohalobaculum sp.]
MRSALIAIGACLLPAALHAQALPLTVSDMQRACAIVSGDTETTSPEDAIAAGACYGAMRGIVQVMQANCRSFAAGQRPATALSAGEIPSADDAIGAFAAWAEGNPAEAEAPAEYGIIVALAQAFPCRRGAADPAPTSGEAGQGAGDADGAGDVQSE